MILPKEGWDGVEVRSMCEEVEGGRRGVFLANQ